jgi:beta-aspartyl-dipeptidase (metallo-type)
VGDGKKGLAPLEELLASSDFPVDMFVPTHLNRNRKIFEEAVKYAKAGGRVDLTAGETTGKGYCISDALEMLINSGVDMKKVTVSSDGNGSTPSTDGGSTGVGKVKMLYDDIRGCVLDKKLDISCVLSTVTENVARVLKLFPRKGTLQAGSDADILVINSEDWTIDKMLVNGEMAVDNGSLLKKGRYEN